MNVFYSVSDFSPGNQKICVAIGVFDGVHLGHQQVIRQTLADAGEHEAHAVVLTFNCHPARIVAPERAPLLLYSLAQKLQVISTFGPHAAVVIHFDQAFSQISAEDFIRDLSKRWRLQSLCVGSGFTFGHRRKGNVALLEKMGAELGFTVHGLASVALDGEVVSSTRIRKSIAAGDLKFAGEMLGRPYSISGKVIQGDRVGHTLGFPTANLDTEGILLPPSGVYLAHARLEQQTHRAVINIGVRPTIQKTDRVSLEAHLLDFNRDLYGSFLEIIPGEKLRDEKKFSSTDELKAQIGRDIAEALTRF